MPENLGNGVTRTLSALKRQFALCLWNDQKPPDDCELNLMGQIDLEALRQAVRAVMPSGFLMDPTRALADYVCDPYFANLFQFGQTRTDEIDPTVWANVNGWLIPVAGVGIDGGDPEWVNRIALNPPPESGTRVDFVFLEVWLARVAPNPSTVNKPDAAHVYKYGNTQQGAPNIDDDILSPHFGFETTERVQLQYRVRIFGDGQGGGQGATLNVYPDGLSDPRICGQGNAASQVFPTYPFVNMRDELGDPALWRAGDGNNPTVNALDTVDGYTYAIPICAIFRRNSQVFTAQLGGAGMPTHNGAFDRTPSAADPTGARVLMPMYLGGQTALTPTATAVSIPVTNFFDSGLDDPGHSASPSSEFFLSIDNEIVGISNIDLNLGEVTVSSRGRWGTSPSRHEVGAPIRFFNTRPDGLFADQIAASDILDLRRGVNPGDWDFHRLLEHNVTALATGSLRTAWKTGNASNSQGVSLVEVDYMQAAGVPAIPDGTEQADGPDGIRMVWSDGAAIQPNVTLLLNNEAILSGGTIGLESGDTFMDEPGISWKVGPDFWPIGFVNKGPSGEDSAWYNGSVILLHIGGQNGNLGARRTVHGTDNKIVRFVSPKEWWKSGYPVVDPRNGNQHPVTLRFVAERAHEPQPPEPTATPFPYPERHPGPMYPWQAFDFAYPFLVLGSRLRDEWRKANVLVDNTLFMVGPNFEIETGFDFDANGAYAVLGADGKVDPEQSLAPDPTKMSALLSRNERTLLDMLTDGGRDFTGLSSEVFVVTYGDPTHYQNNGAFRVIGAGTKGYTENGASAHTRLRVIPVSLDSLFGFVSSPDQPMIFEIRSPITHADDLIGGGSYEAQKADLCIVLTDIGGDTQHPWYKETLGYNADPPEYDLSLPVDGNSRPYAASKMLLDLTLQYHPGRAGMRRIPDLVTRFARTQGDPSSGAYLRQSPSNIDTTFSSATGAPANEAFYDPVHVQTWNRLPALGWPAPVATNYGGNVIGFTEQDREHELFFDAGSKTLIWRPFRSRLMTVQALTYTDIIPNTCLLGSYTYPNMLVKDRLGLFTGSTASGKQMGFAVPWEFMPRFGRQDIPYYSMTVYYSGTPASAPFLPGINHLFRDTYDHSDVVFNIVGGRENAGNASVKTLYLATDLGVPYASSANIVVDANNEPCYSARKVPDGFAANPDGDALKARLRAVHSSDFGAGLKGIQFPPYLGPARLMGVYDRRNFDACSGRTVDTDRVTPEPGAATNLLRCDAARQTLFILQDGAKDHTREIDDHTYIVPLEAFDITRSPSYVPGDTFENMEFVVECMAFGFAKGFINKNNLVLCRLHDGDGDLNEDAPVPGDWPQLQDIGMVIPCPAEANQEAYVAYDRTAYQGDVYGTRAGATRTFSDYYERYGQIPPSSATALAYPIRQYDDEGHQIPEKPNARAFEVLAALDFYTTLGTGKVGGLLYPGTMLDVGFTQPADPAHPRIPDAEDPDGADAKPWRIFPRAFTEGQKSNDSRAMLDITLLDNSLLNPSGTNTSLLRLRLLDGSLLDFYAAKQSNWAAIQALYGIGDDQTFEVNEIVTSNELYQRVQINPGVEVYPGAQHDDWFTVEGARTGDAVIVNPWLGDIDNPHPWVSYVGWVAANDKVRVTEFNTWPHMPWGFPGGNPALPVIAHMSVSGPVPANGMLSFGPVPFAGTDGTDDQAFVAYIHGTTSPGIGDLIWTAKPSVTPGNVVLIVYNPTTAPVAIPASTPVFIALLNPDSVSYNAHKVDLSNDFLDIKVIKTDIVGQPERTMANLVAKINAHPSLLRTVRAASPDGGNTVRLTAVPTGAQGNAIGVQVKFTGTTNSITNVFRLDSPFSNERPVLHSLTRTTLLGGRDLPMNAGDGTSQLQVTGMTERLPLGILVSDCDFLCENPLNDVASAMQTSPAGYRPLQTPLPLTGGGIEFTRFTGAPGELLGMADGKILMYDPFDFSPLGAKAFRLYRGGGSAYVLSGSAPGGPIDWVSTTFSAPLQPVLKGGLLACKALLVRNFRETPFATQEQPGDVVTEGDEIQMVVLTCGIFGDGHTQAEGVTVGGSISPTGYGEGYAAADRYRIAGRPMVRGYNRQVPDPATITLAAYPETDRREV